MRQRLLNAEGLDEIENHPQQVGSCSRLGDVLLLDASKTIFQPSSTVILLPLTINGEVQRGKLDEAVISCTYKRTTLTCP